LETLHFQAPQLPWVVLPSHWSTVKKHGNWTNDFVKEYDWQIWTEFDQWEGWCRDRWFIINLSYFSVFIQNIHQFCQGKMRRSSFWTRGFAALKRCSPIFLDKPVWLRSLNKPCYVHMHRCDTLIHVHEEEIWNDMNEYLHLSCSQTTNMLRGSKNPWHVVFDSQRKPKKNAGHRMVSAHAKKPSWVTARLGAEMDGSYFWVVNLSNLNAEIPPGRNAEDFWGDPLRDAMACWSIREKALLALTRRLLGSKHLFIYPPHLSSVCIDLKKNPRFVDHVP
jgi:hypothetical protein